MNMASSRTFEVERTAALFHLKDLEVLYSDSLKYLGQYNLGDRRYYYEYCFKIMTGETLLSHVGFVY
jgi:hypothetical protein